MTSRCDVTGNGMETNMQSTEIKIYGKQKKGVPGMRYIFTAMGFLCFTVNYTLRVGINIAMVAMINSTAVYNKSIDSSECGHSSSSFDFGNSTNSHRKEGEFTWSSEMQNFVLGSFYVGYCISQVPAARLAEVYSAKTVLGYGTLVTSVLSLLTPLATRWNVYVLILIRIIEGLAQGVMLPSMYVMIGKWIPDQEKGLLATVIQNGINLGTIVAMPAAGYMCNSDLFGGWPSVFYIFGLCGCVWFIAWLLLISDAPVTHPWITIKELKYITDNQNIQHMQKLPPLPWSAILRSVPFWALLITQFGQDWCFYTIITDLPTYMDAILHVKIETNGLAICLPYLVQAIVSNLVGAISDYCLRRKYCSVQFVRKFCNTVSGLGTVGGLVVVCLAGCNIDMTVIAIIIGQGIGGFSFCGYMLTPLDLSPEYAGTLAGIANTVSSMSGFIAPAIVGGLTESQQTLRQWHIVFYIVIILVSITSVVFLFFSTTKKQNWAPWGPTHSLIDNDDDPDMRYGSLEKSTHFEIQ